MADRQVLPSNTFEQFRVEFNELATDVGDIAGITGASGIIASATDIVEAVTLLNTAVNTSDLDGAGDSGTFAVDLDTQSLTIAGTTNEIETVASGQTLTIGLPNNVTISGNATISGNITNGSVNLTFPTVGGAISTEGFSIALATALG
tara:strand:- start:1220 stop:1663 length:444 start_codon:yes stop_codon:yes gene_type:complete